MYDFEVGIAKNILVLSTSIVPTFDWDTPDPIHPQNCVSFLSKEEGLDFIQRKVHSLGVCLKLYETPGGLRGISLNCISRREYEVLAGKLKVDPIYLRLTCQRNKYCLRVTPKQGRKQDYIARPLGIRGSYVSPPDTECLDFIALHDALIAKHAA